MPAGRAGRASAPPMKLQTIRHQPTVEKAVSLAMRALPFAGLALIAAYVAAQQAVSPQRRVVKTSVMLILMALMLRFDMVYSVYLFTALFPYPSGISIGSTNKILMTIIPLIWFIRASSTKSPLFRRTRLDGAFGLFLFAHVLSFVNVETDKELVESLKVMWRTVTTILYFYMIVNFVDSERKLLVLTKVLCATVALAMSTALIELVAPGAVVIPGWLSLERFSGQGRLSFRVEGMRAQGVLQSHALISDFGTQVLFLMLYHTVKSKNPLEKTIWGALSLLTIAAILSTANRGAFLGLAVGAVSFLVLFRKRIPITRLIVGASAVIGILAVTEIVLTRYTVAVSVFDRLAQTQMYGVVPENRTMTWAPALNKGLEHPFIGGGLYYDIEQFGLERLLWPHNGFIFYFCTIGLLGLLSFLFVLWRAFQYSNAYRLPAAEGTAVGDICRLLQIQLVMFFVENQRGDFQRDDIYPYMVWLMFGMIAAVALIIEGYMKNEGDQRTGGGVESADGVPGQGPPRVAPN